jgi:hypothetical protein
MASIFSVEQSIPLELRLGMIYKVSWGEYWRAATRADAVNDVGSVIYIPMI